MSTLQFPVLPRPDLDEADLRRRRLAHLRDAMCAAGVELLLLTNPVSIRYATGYRGYSAFQSHIPSQYLLVPVSGPVVLHGAYTDDLDTIDRCEVAHSITTFDAGLDHRTALDRLVRDLAETIGDAGLSTDATVGVERLTPATHAALDATPWRIVDGEQLVELTRSRKIAGELTAMRHSIAVAQAAMCEMRRHAQPGRTENGVWAVLHAVNVANDGDGVDGRMFCSGPRTNPWYQEASDRVIERGDVVAFDTDMIGPYGYCADVSRTWVCDTAPTRQQLDLHRRAVEEIEHNMALLRPGASFRELSEHTFRHPERFVAHRYACAFHGVGLCDEYPKIPYPHDWAWTGYDGELEVGTVLSVESFVGSSDRRDGGEGVKLEQMVQVTATGAELLSTYPLDLLEAGDGAALAAASRHS